MLRRRPWLKRDGVRTYKVKNSNFSRLVCCGGWCCVGSLILSGEEAVLDDDPGYLFRGLRLLGRWLKEIRHGFVWEARVRCEPLASAVLISDVLVVADCCLRFTGGGETERSSVWTLFREGALSPIFAIPSTLDGERTSVRLKERAGVGVGAGLTCPMRTRKRVSTCVASIWRTCKVKLGLAAFIQYFMTSAL